MRAAFLVVAAALCGAQVLDAQVAIRRAIPRVFAHVPTDQAILQQRIAGILRRDVRLRSEYEDFVRDLSALGREAAPEILALMPDAATDRFVTEVLLRMGGPAVHRWVDRVLGADDHHLRQAFLAGVPAVALVDGSVRSQLTRFLHDTSPQVRILAIEKLHELATGYELLTRCGDYHREVARAAILTVSRRWVFLDHGGRELQHLRIFVEALERHRRDHRWNVGDGFLLAFHKDRIADTTLGRQLRRRVGALPWFASSEEPVAVARLQRIRTELGRRTAGRDRLLAERLRDLPATAGSELLIMLAEDPDVSVRLAACGAGLALLDPGLASAFVRFLKDPDPGVRGRARQVLEQTGYYADQKQRWNRDRRL